MKSVYLISYELNNPESRKNEAELRNAIKSLTGIWWRYTGIWLIAGEGLTAKSVHEKLAPHLKLKDASPDDSILVIKVVPTDRYGYLPQSAWDWLKKMSAAK